MVVTGRAREALVRRQRAVSLYRQLSGKDPRVAEAEVRRITDQLRAIDERVRPMTPGPGPGPRAPGPGPMAPGPGPRAANRAELEAATGALLAYHLGGRQTDDVLLGEIQAAWAEYEATGAERKDQMLGQVARDQWPSQAEISRQERAAMDRYLAGWRGWFDRHAELDASPDRDG